MSSKNSGVVLFYLRVDTRDGTYIRFGSIRG